MSRGTSAQFLRSCFLWTAVAAVQVGCGSGALPAPLDTPFAAPDFALRDGNPDSPTYDQTRRLSEVRGRVVMLYFASYSCGYCAQQFLLLDNLLRNWRRDGLAQTDVELWLVGYPGTESNLAVFASGSAAVCLEDGAEPGSEVYASYGAAVDDLLAIDRAGQVRVRFNLIRYSLADATLRALLDGWVRDLVAEPSG